jgi:hypothetical protein
VDGEMARSADNGIRFVRPPQLKSLYRDFISTAYTLAVLVVSFSLLVSPWAIQTRRNGVRADVGQNHAARR